MMKFKEFAIRPEVHPMIYAYKETDAELSRYIKVGYTTRDINQRVAEQHNILKPGSKHTYDIILRESAIRNDGTIFTDKDVHRVLERKGFKALKTKDGKKTEFFDCKLDDVKAAILAVRERLENEENRTENFKMRAEQKAAVKKTKDYFESVKRENKKNIPKFLWNAKMRFGKTFTTYQLAKEMDFKRVLILTFKPAVKQAWRDDLLNHIDFEGWQFISNDKKDPTIGTIDDQYERYKSKCKNDKKDYPLVCFGSFQDFLGVDSETGGIKPKNKWVHEINWDLVVFDEYHFGAWKDKAKDLFAFDDDEIDDEDINEKKDESVVYDESCLPTTTNYYLFLSGTPFKALNNGEFIEEQIFSWTYSDEQNAKESWEGPNNPYASLPRMVMLTYKVPDEIEKIAKGGEFNEFDLNVFFSTTGKGEEAKFVYEEHVQKWLDLIRGDYKEDRVNVLKLGNDRPPMPFSDARLISTLTHTLWFMQTVDACFAMQNLLKQKQNVFYHDYKVIVIAGKNGGVGLDALDYFESEMGNPLETKTITLTCGKLTTGVTVKPWTGILMLRNLKSPETYFQSAFRVQSPWTIKKDDGETEIIKKECYIFDFAINRALRQVSDYSIKLSSDANKSPEVKVGEFINFLPILAYDGYGMKQINASEILDITTSGTSATLLAKRWQSALLVNVDNDTLKRLMANSDAMKALMNIEGFRSLNDDIKTIINKSEHVKDAKRNSEKLSKKEKEQLTAEEKEFKTKRKEIQEKLIKFATRIPIFMFLTDFREETLKDVITKLESNLFKRVTGLDVKDFELLVSLNLFNEGLMNEAVYKFRRYEDSSLVYTGIDKHLDEKVGLYSTVLTRKEYETIVNQG